MGEQASKFHVASRVDAAVETIKHGGRGLYGLVNNAGIGTIGTLADMKPEEFDLVMALSTGEHA